MGFERVLVTGGSGRLGRFVVDELMDRCAVTVLDIKPPRQDLPFVEASILDHAALAQAMAGQEAVIHLAGFDDGDGPRERDYVETNVQGAWNVFDAAEAAGARQMAVASSTAALGLGYDRAPDYLPVDEAHPLLTDGTYGLSKEAIETMARHYVRRGRLKIVCLRPTLIVRPEAEAEILVQLTLPDPDAESPEERGTDDGVPPYGALSATRTYVRSRDAARAFRLALDYQGADYDVFNVAAGDGIGRPETLARMEAVYDRLPELRDAAYFREDPHASVLDACRARDLLNWQAEGDWRDVEAAHCGPP